MRSLAIVAVFAAFTTTACGHGLNLVTWEPGRLEPRGARTLVLVDGEGRASARQVAVQLVKSEGARGWWRIVDRSPEGLKLSLAGGRGTVEGSTAPLPQDAMWVRIDVVDWTITDTQIEQQGKNGVRMMVPASKGNVVLQISIANADGDLLMREQEYPGSVVVSADQAASTDVLGQATELAVASFLTELGPRQRSWTVQLDDSDPGLKDIVERLSRDKISLDAAESALRAYLKKNPTNSIATYNLAVVLDAQGRYDDALAAYNAAIQNMPRPYYRATRDGCRERARAHKALAVSKHAVAPAGSPPPAPPR